MKPISHSIASHNASSAWRVTRLHLPSHQATLALQFKHWTAPDELTLRALSTLCHASLNFSSLMRIVHHLSLKLRAHFAPLCAPSIKTAPLARLARSTVSNPMQKENEKEKKSKTTLLVVLESFFCGYLLQLFHEKKSVKLLKSVTVIIS